MTWILHEDLFVCVNSVLISLFVCLMFGIVSFSAEFYLIV